MPAMHFYLLWPDGSEDCCYSPSTIIRQHLQVGMRYPIKEFEQLCAKALHDASDRVHEKFGYACSSAMEQLAAIQQKLITFSKTGDTFVTVTRITQAS